MKPSKLQLVGLTSAIFSLSGCITNGNQYDWAKNSISNIEQERAQDDNECLAKSYEIFTQSPIPSNNCIGNCIDNGNGLSKGLLAGTLVRENRDVRKARENFYESCMIGKGWQKQPIQ